MEDLVWLRAKAKLHGLLNLLEEHPDALVLAWFEGTVDEYTRRLADSGRIYPVRSVRLITASEVQDKTVIFLEHYPLRSKEEQLMQNWAPQQVLVLNALEEPLFQRFGGARLMELMKKMGMEEYEQIQHPMITRSIAQAQRKLDKMLKGRDILAGSLEEWFEKLGR